MNAGADLGTCERNRLPQIETLSQIRDSGLPRGNLRDPGRREQPRRKRFLARSSTCARQQLEQRRWSEQIQIVRIQMVGIAEPLSLLTSAGPSILDPRQAALVQ